MEEQDQNEKKAWMMPEIEELDIRETSSAFLPGWAEGGYAVGS